MNKILTISIAGYNVEKYIHEALDSLCIDTIIDDLEVFVVDDGGKDRTYEIAKEYEKRYPNSIHAIHKENGGWGSTVNYSIQHATGKYFRLLDGDDYFDKEGLVSLVRALQDITADVVYTPYRRFDDRTKKTVERFDVQESINKNVVLSIKALNGMDFVMHSSTFLTSLLKEHEIRILEHCFYTDNEYRAKAMAYVKNAYVLQETLYQYRVGREGQSVDISGLRKHYKDNLKVFRELNTFYKTLREDDNKQLVMEYIKSVAEYQYDILILLNEKKEITEFDKELKAYGTEVYSINSKMISKLRQCNFSNFWIASLMRNMRNKYSRRVKMLING